MVYLHLITVVFTVLKMTETIDWSWFYVLAPSFLHLGLFAVSLLALLVLAVKSKSKYMK